MVDKTQRSVARKKVAKHAIKKAKSPKSTNVAVAKNKPSKTKLARTVVGYIAIVCIGFIASQFVVNAAIYAAVVWLNLPILTLMSEAVLQLIMSLLIYVVAFIVSVYVANRVFSEKTTLGDVGLAQQLPRWRDVGLAPLVFITYMLTVVVVMGVVRLILPDLIDVNQQQAIGFSNVTTRYELIAAYVTLTIMAPFAEELLFRGYLFGKLRKHLSAVITIALTALLFALLHLVGVQDNGEIQLQWAVVVDTFVLAIALGILRERTKSIWAGVLLHMIKNSIAFFLLFVAPLLNIQLPGM